MARKGPAGARQPSTGAQETMRYLGTVFSVAAILATVFTAWTPASLRPGELAGRLVELLSGGDSGELGEQALGPEAANLGLRIGIVIGHSGSNPDTGLADPGSVCPDGLTELEVNRTIGSSPPLERSREDLARALRVVGRFRWSFLVRRSGRWH